MPLFLYVLAIKDHFTPLRRHLHTHKECEYNMVSTLYAWLMTYCADPFHLEAVVTVSLTCLPVCPTIASKHT